MILECLNQLEQLKLSEIAGVVFGLLCVWFLIKSNVLTWPVGIIHTLLSLYIYWKVKLYADLILYIIYFFMNLYGWYFWVYGKKKDEHEGVVISRSSFKQVMIVLTASAVGSLLAGYVLNLYTDASLPFWDSTTTVFSLSAIWLTARKKIESWLFWFFVDVLACGIYVYKEIYFYAFMYLIYVGMAVSGYLNWKKEMKTNAI